MQHLNQSSVPVKSNLLTEYPWSPRWEVGRMAERLWLVSMDSFLDVLFN